MVAIIMSFAGPGPGFLVSLLLGLFQNTICVIWSLMPNSTCWDGQNEWYSYEARWMHGIVGGLTVGKHHRTDSIWLIQCL